MKTLGELYPRAFVTGASGGLGEAFARMLLKEGVRVWGTARDTARLSGYADARDFHPVTLNLDDGDAAVAAFNRAADEAGLSAVGSAKADGFDLVIQNAGYGTFGDFAAVPSASLQVQLQAMVVTTSRLSQAAVKRWTGRGCLVHVSSLAAEFPIPFMAGYNVAKAGLSALSESLMIECRGRPVTVIDFRPGDYRTQFNQAMQGNSPSAAFKDGDPRRAGAWRAIEGHLQASPPVPKAAADLRRALLRGRSGVVRSGGFFQATLAPALAALVPLPVVRAVLARYYGL